MALLKLLSILFCFTALHLDFIYEGDKYIAVWFMLNACSMACLSMDKGNIAWINDVSNGFFIGYLIEVIRCRYLGYDENHYGEILLIAFLVTGFVWRKYKDNTITAVMVTSLTTALKWVISKILSILFS